MIESKDTLNKRPNFTHGDIFEHDDGAYYLLVCACDDRDNTNEFGFVCLETGWTFDGHFHNCINAHNITADEFRKATHSLSFTFVGLLKGVSKV